MASKRKRADKDDLVVVMPSASDKVASSDPEVPVEEASQGIGDEQPGPQRAWSISERDPFVRTRDLENSLLGFKDWFVKQHPQDLF